MVQNFLQGGAAISVLAKQHQLVLKVIDCGVNHDFTASSELVDLKIRKGTRDSTLEAAMSLEECERAIRNGRELVKTISSNAILLGEMGIGNTSAASLLMARLLSYPLELCVGAGTGLKPEGIARKIKILQKALDRDPQSHQPLEILASFGGYEIATMVGSIFQSFEEHRVIVVDGFITTVAVFVASRLNPQILSSCIFSHRSEEKAHGTLLKELKAEPLVDLGLRLGEGSGAALAWPLLESSVKILQEMASFDSAQVSKSI